MKFEKIFEVKWADVDQNRHVRHSAYYDYGAYVRIRFITESGYGAKKSDEIHLGLILFKEECHFIREISPDDKVRVNILKGDINKDGSRWTVYHEIYNQNEEKVAHIKAIGAWMDTSKRKLTIPPADLANAFHKLSTGEDYVYKKTSK